MARNQKLVVPGCKQALDAMKYEIAAEIGLYGGGSGAGNANVEFASELGSAGSVGGVQGGYWGHVASRDVGHIGGTITARLIKKAEEALFSL